MDVILSIIPAVILFFQGIGFKLYAKKGGLVRANEFTFNAFNFLLCFLITLPFALVGKPLDGQSVLYGLIYGVVFIGMVVFYNKSMSTGNIAFVNFVMALAMLIPITFGAIILEETISVFQYVGLALVIIAAFLVSFGQRIKKTDKNAEEVVIDAPKSNKWTYVYVVIACICSGTIGFLAKYFDYIYEDLQKFQMLDTAFLLAFVILLIVSFATKGIFALPSLFKDKWFIITLAIVVLATAFGNITFVNFSTQVDGAIFFPIANGLPMVLAVLVSPLFKEKISIMSLCGIIIGVVAVVLLNF